MIGREEFEQKRDSFAVWLKKQNSMFAELESLREEFVRRFPLEKLATLPLDQYVVGKQKKNTYCYWLETRLREIGSIKGGTTAGSKFGIYFGKTKQDSRMMYRFPPKYGTSVDGAYDTIKQAIVDLLAAGEKKISKLYKATFSHRCLRVRFFRPIILISTLTFFRKGF